MLVLQGKRTLYKTWWVALVTAFVNEGKNGRRGTLQEVMRIANKQKRRHAAKPHDFAQSAACACEALVEEIKELPKDVGLPKKKKVAS